MGQSEHVQGLDPHGDVILVVGSAPYTRLRVSSSTLSNVSSVFGVLFSPRFREGKSPRSADDPVEIKLPADDGKAMSDLCSLLHHKTPASLRRSHQSSSCAIYNLAVAADKYACADALSLQAAGMLLKFKVQTPATHPYAMCDLAAAAYLLGESTSLNFFAWQLVGWVAESFSGLRRSRPSAQVLPASFWLVLEDRRTRARNLLATTLPELGNPNCLKHRCDNYDAKFTSHLSSHLESWPPHFDEDDTSILGAAFAIGKLPDAFRQRPSCQHTGARMSVSTLEFRSIADALRHCCAGDLCLRCVRESRVGACDHKDTCCVTME